MVIEEKRNFITLKSAFPPSPFEVFIFTDQFAGKMRNCAKTSVTFDNLENILNIGNKIFASAIWWKKYEYIFFYDKKIAQAREASAIYSLKN